MKKTVWSIVCLIILSVSLDAGGKEYPAASHITKDDILKVSGGTPLLYGMTKEYTCRYIGETKEDHVNTVMHFADKNGEVLLSIRKLRLSRAYDNAKDILFQMKFKAPSETRQNNKKVFNPPFEAIRMSYGRGNSMYFSTRHSGILVRKQKDDSHQHKQSFKYNSNHNFIYDGRIDIQQAIDRGDSKTASKKKVFWKEVSQIASLRGNAIKGKENFMICMGCHTGLPINMGGVIPPSLEYAGAIYDKNYLITLIKNPAIASNVDHLYKDTTMHPMGSIKIMMADDQQIADVVAYILKEKSKKPTPEQAFMEACSRCHAMKRENITQLGKTPNFNYKKDALKYQLKVAGEEELVMRYLGKLPPDLSNIVNERSEQFLAEFIENPQSKYHDSAMPRVGLSKDGYEKIISYLKGTLDSE